MKTKRQSQPNLMLIQLKMRANGFCKRWPPNIKNRAVSPNKPTTGRKMCLSIALCDKMINPPQENNKVEKLGQKVSTSGLSCYVAYLAIWCERQLGTTLSNLLNSLIIYFAFAQFWIHKQRCSIRPLTTCNNAIATNCRASSVNEFRFHYTSLNVFVKG